MQGSTAAQYPGEFATSGQLLRLADQYRAAAQVIMGLGRTGDPLSRAPYRLNAIHAIELYLNALLVHVGHEPSRIRALHHNLAAHAELAAACGLTLRMRTQAHLRTLADKREYLISRYAPEVKLPLSEVNRLSATVEEVAHKVAMIVTDASPALAVTRDG